MTQTPMTTREAIEEALYALGEYRQQELNNQQVHTAKHAWTAMNVLCDYYSFDVNKFINATQEA